MYTPTDQLTTFFCGSGEISRVVITISAISLLSPDFLPTVLPSTHLPEGRRLGLSSQRWKTSWREMLDARSLTSCFSYTASPSSGAGFDPGRAGNVGCAHSGEKIEESFSCNLGTRSTGSSGHIPRSWLLQKRYDLIRSHPAWQGPSEAAEIRSSAATCTTPNSPGKHWRLLGFGVPSASRGPITRLPS